MVAPDDGRGWGSGDRRAQIGQRSTGDSRGPSTLEYAGQNTRRVAVTVSDFVGGVVGGRGAGISRLTPQPSTAGLS